MMLVCVCVCVCVCGVLCVCVVYTLQIDKNPPLCLDSDVLTVMHQTFIDYINLIIHMVG